MGTRCSWSSWLRWRTRAPNCRPRSGRQSRSVVARAGPAGTTLRAAAALGPDIDLDVLAAVTGDPPGRLLDHLEEGVRRRLLVEVGTTFVFAHALVREALASTLSASRVAFLHREAARALAGRPDADPLRGSPPRPAWGRAGPSFIAAGRGGPHRPWRAFIMRNRSVCSTKRSLSMTPRQPASNGPGCTRCWLTTNSATADLRACEGAGRRGRSPRSCRVVGALPASLRRGADLCRSGRSRGDRPRDSSQLPGSGRLGIALRR